MHTLSPALSPMIYSITRRIANVEVEHAPRLHGRSGYTLGQLWVHATNNLVGYSNLPLRLLAGAGGLGLLLSLGAGLAMVLSVGLVHAAVPAWAVLALLMGALASIHFLAFALLGDCVLRLLQRSNGMPQYRVRATTVAAAAVAGAVLPDGTAFSAAAMPVVQTAPAPGSQQAGVMRQTPGLQQAPGVYPSPTAQRAPAPSAGRV